MNPQEKRVAAVSKDEGDGGEINFKRLPDDLLLHIFKKLVDLKTLCLSSLVCKRFASIIPHVDHICFSFPQSKPNPTPPINPNKNTQEPISSNFGESQFLGATRFSKKFDEIRCLYMEIPYNFGANLLFKWKGVFRRNIETFVFLSFSSIHKKQQNMNDNEEEETEPSMDELWYRCVLDSITRYGVLRIFVQKFHLLDRVTMTDPNKHGMICLSKEELIEIRNSSCSFPKFDEVFPKPVKQWYIAKMELRSGYIVKGVNLAVMGMDGGYADCNFVDGSVIPRELGVVGDDVFGEAMKEIMLNPRTRESYVEKSYHIF